MATYWSSAPGGGYGSLSAVHALFQQPALLTAGWFHYLAFDLFVGTWIAREGERAGIAPLLLLPCFVLTFLFGPVGLLAFLALRVAPWCMWLARELHRRQPQLAWFGGILLTAMVPALLAAWLDPRTLPGVGVGVWVKPLKFMASVSLYALTTAWLLGDLPRVHRGSRVERTIIAVVIAMGLFEVAYITLQGRAGASLAFQPGLDLPRRHVRPDGRGCAVAQCHGIAARMAGGAARATHWRRRTGWPWCWAWC
jgi:hypothetical protein